MRPVSQRRKLLGGAMGLVLLAWGIDSLTGGPGPRPAGATPTLAAAARPAAPPADPADLDAVIESLCDDHAARAALPFDEVTRDLFVPTPRMQAAVAAAAPIVRAEPESHGEPVAEPPPFEAQHELQGVLTGRVALALIDGLLFRRGAEIDGYRLVELQRDYVVLQRGRSQVVLRVLTAGGSE